MAKHREKHTASKKVVHLQEFQEEPQAKVEYEDPPAEEPSEEKQKAWQAPKAFYRVALVLLVVVLGLAIWLNRESLTPESGSSCRCEAPVRGTATQVPSPGPLWRRAIFWLRMEMLWCFPTRP